MTVLQLFLLLTAPAVGGTLARCVDRSRRPRLRALRIAVAAAAMGVVAAALLVADSAAGLAAACYLGWVLIPLAALDLRIRRLPDPLTAALAGGGVLAVLAGVGPTPLQALIGGLGGGLAFLAIGWGYRVLRGREGLGLGDVKLVAALGLWLGPEALPAMITLAAGGGLLATLLWAWWTGLKAVDTYPAPLGTFLALAAFPVWLFAHGAAPAGF
ncbi:MAG: A24 family peptidase [Pseudomonadota bacterium]